MCRCQGLRALRDDCLIGVPGHCREEHAGRNGCLLAPLFAAWLARAGRARCCEADLRHPEDWALRASSRLTLAAWVTAMRLVRLKVRRCAPSSWPPCRPLQHPPTRLRTRAGKTPGTIFGGAGTRIAVINTKEFLETPSLPQKAPKTSTLLLRPYPFQAACQRSEKPPSVGGMGVRGPSVPGRFTSRYRGPTGGFSLRMWGHECRVW